MKNVNITEVYCQIWFLGGGGGSHKTNIGEIVKKGWLEKLADLGVGGGLGQKQRGWDSNEHYVTFLLIYVPLCYNAPRKSTLVK